MLIAQTYKPLKDKQGVFAELIFVAVLVIHSDLSSLSPLSPIS